MPRSHPGQGQSASGREDSPQMVTATGWRVIGAAAEHVSDPLGLTAAATLGPRDILYAAHFTVRPKSSRADGVGVVLQVLNGALSSFRDGGEPLALENAVAESAGRFHGVTWETFAIEEDWAGELTWIHPHPVITGLPCTTHVALTRHRERTELTLHVGTAGGNGAVRGYVGAGQARPAFLAELHRVARLVFNGAEPEVQTLDATGVEWFVERVLLSGKRTHPVAVLAPLEAANALDPPEYHVLPGQMASELLGLAHLWVIDRHTTTFRLSDAVRDKRLSCFFGALRIYMPGFSRADSGLDHPLLVHERVGDPVERAGLLGELALAVRDRVPVSFPVEALRDAARPEAPVTPRDDPLPETGEMAPDPAGGRPPPPVAEPIPAPPDPGVASLLLAAVETLTETMATRLGTIAELQEKLIDEVSRLRTATVVRSANSAGIERRLGQFERTLRELAHPGDGGEEEPERAVAREEGEEKEESREESEFTLTSMLQSAASEYDEDLLILDSAFASAAESPFEDVLRVATNLKAMAELAHRRQEGRLGMSLRDAFGEAGVDYRGGIGRSTSKRLQGQYQATLPDGQVVECREHIVLGNSYDPRYCLRVYFTSRAPGEPRFVIAHVGRHFDVMTTT